LSAPDVVTPLDGEKAPASPRADLVTAAVLFALGVAIMAQAWSMPRFVEQSGTGLTAPGIVPGFYGAMIALLAGAGCARRGAAGGRCAGHAAARRAMGGSC
jgi:hypothetical protein